LDYEVPVARRGGGVLRVLLLDALGATAIVLGFGGPYCWMFIWLLTPVICGACVRRRPVLAASVVNTLSWLIPMTAATLTQALPPIDGLLVVTLVIAMISLATAQLTWGLAPRRLGQWARAN
jgi:hypothetical protein